MRAAKTKKEFKTEITSNVGAFFYCRDSILASLAESITEEPHEVGTQVLRPSNDASSRLSRGAGGDTYRVRVRVLVYGLRLIRFGEPGPLI